MFCYKMPGQSLNWENCIMDQVLNVFGHVDDQALFRPLSKRLFKFYKGEGWCQNKQGAMKKG